MKLMYTASLAALLLAAPALAQTTSPSTTPTTPSTSPTTPSQSPTTTPPSQRPTTTTPSTTTQPSQAQTTTQTGQMWYSAQNNELRGSDLIGMTVRNQAGESIGEVNDLLLDANGRLLAIVVGVGGFLGVGEREVAIAPQGFRMMLDSNGDATVTINTTRETLSSAPAWTWKR